MGEKKEGINRKNIFSLLIVFLFAIFSINFISSAITVVSPANYSNFTGAFGPLVFFNVSYINGTDFTDATNVTFYYNLSGAWTKIGSSSPTLVCSRFPGAVLESCNVSLNLSGLTDGVYSINATLANASTTASGVYSYLLAGATGFGVTTNIMFDSTPPTVNFSGITNTVNNGNYSGMKHPNVSVSNWPAGISSVYFNVTYANGTQVSFIKALSTTAPYYNITLNTSTLYDGLYNLTVYANDTLNNLNKSQSIQITVDNTVPTVSLNCTPVNANRGQSVTCTCSGGFGVSGISTGTFSDTGNPDDSTVETFTAASFVRTFTSSNTGTFTPSCSVTSNAGLGASTTTTYAVILTSSNPSTTSSPGSTTTTTPAVPVTTTQAFNTITPSSPVTMSNFGTDTVKQIQIEVSQTASNVNVQVDRYDSKPAAVLVDKSDSYKYLHVDTQNLTGKLSKATMTIQVNKTWVSGKGLAKEEVALYRYDESTNVWNLLPTTFSTEDSTYYTYNVVLDHFSYFAIAPNKAQVTTPAPTTASTGFLGLPYWAWIAIVVVLIIIGVGFSLKKKLK
ncbi:Uncharacterised protein [uncultured archaeon]|nr:Uncharacterised protein [uncultured archaeon]